MSGRAIVDNGLVILCVVILHNLCGMLLGGFCARHFGLDKAQCRAMTIEVGMQNSGLASTLPDVLHRGRGHRRSHLLRMAQRIRFLSLPTA